MSFLPDARPRQIALFLVAFFFTAAGITHFTITDFFLSMVPPALPAPLALVYISGVAEILGGIGMLIPQVRRAAGWGLILLLIAVFPANIFMAMNPGLYPDITASSLYIRLPFQFLFAWLVWFAAISPRSQTQ